VKKKLSKYIPKGEFSRNIITLMTGTTIAQAIPVAISPILTRLYSPEDFGVLALFLSITAITGTIASAKYEQAILLPKEEEEAFNLLALGFFINLFMSISIFFMIIFFHDGITSLLGEKKIGIWLYWIPLSTFALGIFNILNFYNLREKKFKNISLSQVTQSSSLVITQVGLGLIKNGAFGLITGRIISYFSGNLILLKALKGKKITHKINRSKIISLAKKYKKFPLFSMPSIFINTLNLNIINFLISSVFSITTLGFYSLTQRIIGIPARVIGNSFSQVYFQKATQEYHHYGQTSRIFIKTLKKMIIIAFPIFLLLFFIAEPAFAFIFGEKWRIAGTYAQILIPLAFIRFYTSPLSVTLNIHQKQEVGMFINIIMFITIQVIFYVAKIYKIDFIPTLKIFSFVISLEYLSALYIYYVISKKQ